MLTTISQVMAASMHEV